MKSNFNQLLRSKIAVTPSKSFDQKFWMKFNQEFNPSRPPIIIWIRENYLLLGSSLTAAALAFFVLFNTPYVFTPKKDIVVAHEIMESKELLNDLDLLLDFDDEVALQDDDWNDLLNIAPNKNGPSNETEDVI